ncbi:rhomboid family intramembrane serine protease [Membranicola marinus]|uniref:Rhomboid family intramembrane serine protease n=1 Tax=Membranihabitans marinus TaxID=1227546 RepID=A0A953L803_9BACT|nr:rhomboid family intramembrane serine protease [Membranihabitans marinus]MBY5957165.1 rhomboid family intramembrane serine protease [Membranihabitans marinus]
MFDSIKKDLEQQFRYGGMTIRLVLINLGVFVGIMMIRLILFIVNGGQVPGFFHTLTDGLSIANSWKLILFRPWTLVTHMFLHLSFFHILINMLYLYWFGWVLENLVGERKVLNTYVLSGLSGAVLFFIFSGFLYEGTTYALGASAAVMGIAVAAATMAPDHEFHLLFIGRVKLKFLVLGLVLLDFIMIPAMSNSGGHIAHLGGAFMGFFYIRLLYQGIDLGDINFRPRMKRPKFDVYVNKEKKNSTMNRRPMDKQDQIDRILEKIKISGYENLTQEEKDFLYEASKK